MIGHLSKTSGIFLIPQEDISSSLTYDLVNNKLLDKYNFFHSFVPEDDWYEIESENSENLLKLASSKYWVARATSYVQLIIEGLDEELEKSIFEHVEEMLISDASPDDVLDQLLIAPLVEPECLHKPIERALSLGHGVVGAILDDLLNYQPWLNKFVEKWLSLPDELFLPFSQQKSFVWNRINENCDFKSLLCSIGGKDFLGIWHQLTFSFKSPLAIGAANRIGKELCSRLFPYEQANEKITLQSDENENRLPTYSKKRIDSRAAFLKAHKQISSIIDSISEGRDDLGEKYLLQLIQEQTSFNKNSSFVVKSLCNIAQKSADLFRFDFEYICLEKARELGPSDTWTMIQLGDHFKRLGKYEEAIEILTLAKEHGDWAMANSGIADVYSQMGRYEEAIRIYKSLPNWESEPEINTAIADILRKTGNFEEARSGYINLIKLAHQNPVKFAPSEIRARVGLAEIEKSQGHLQQALASYESIINESSFPPKDGLVYRLTKCRILKNLGRLAEAFEISDQVALEFPFSSEARFTRGALLGLIGKPSEGLEDFSQNYSENSLRKWLRYFFSGLLLLKINSFEQARTNLLEELPKAINCNDDLAVSRMSAVVYFLRSNQIKEAQNLIVKIPEIVDYNQNYLSLVLKLHLAAKDSDKAKVKHFVNLIESLTPFCEQIHEAIGFIRCGNFEEATLLEIDSLLQLVA